MNLTRANYVPILKWKRAEQGALFDLSENKKDILMPLIELVMPKPRSETVKKGEPPKPPKSFEEKYAEVIESFKSKRISEIPAEIEEVWKKRPIFLDFSLLYPEVRFDAFNQIAKECANRSMGVVPVFNIDDDESFKASALKLHLEDGADLCIRLTAINLTNIDLLNWHLKKYLSLVEEGSSRIYLLIDLKENDRPADYMLAVERSQDIIGLQKWEGLIIACGSFPVDLSDCKRDKDNHLPRQDWLNWQDAITRLTLKRALTFADYGIRCPIYIEQYQFLEPTASVKYTIRDSWWVVKGEKRKYEHFLAAAKQIATNERYFGADFSSGDTYIQEKSLHFDIYALDPSVKGTGTTELWLKAGMNHHLSLVADQLSTAA
jgi:hypothetical protein